MEDTNEKPNLALLILLGIILIAAFILILKVTGIIQPSDSKQENDTITDSSYTYIDKAIEKYENSIKVITRQNILYSVISLAIAIIISIGICKLYIKLELPKAIVVFTFIYPILAIVEVWLSGIVSLIVSIVFLILGIMSLYYYFKAVGMPRAWGAVPFIAIVAASFGISSIIVGTQEFLLIIALILFVAWIIAYIISNVKLGKMFNKGVPFIIGLAILPFIFQPILGYSKNSKLNKQE